MRTKSASCCWRYWPLLVVLACAGCGAAKPPATSQAGAKETSPGTTVKTPQDDGGGSGSPTPSETVPPEETPTGDPPPEKMHSHALPPDEPSSEDPPASSQDPDKGLQIKVRAKAQGASHENSNQHPSSHSRSNEPFTTVEVFYATDRAAFPVQYDSIQQRLVRFLPTLACGFGAVLCVLAVMQTRRTSIWILLGIFVLGTGSFGWYAGSVTLDHIRRAEHSGPVFSTDRNAGGLQLGVCQVSIPGTHHPGELEGPHLSRGEILDDASKHVVLQLTQRLDDADFHSRLRDKVSASPQQDLFVFIHGFNVTFENATRRTAQMAHDMHFEGAPIVYSWPAHDWSLLTYPADENNITWTVPHLKQFLLDVAAQSQAKNIHLIAHSMGNRALTSTLKELALEFKQDSRIFNQVILAAPDVDAEEFRDTIAPRIAQTAERVTLYASSRDGALKLSQLAHHYPRAGDSGPGLVVVPGVETIDVSAVDHSPFGHLYYGQSDVILQDLAVLLGSAASAGQRGLMSAETPQGYPYWRFAPTATARIPGEDQQR